MKENSQESQLYIDVAQLQWLIGYCKQAIAAGGKALQVGCGSKPIAGAINIDPNPSQAHWRDLDYDVCDLPADWSNQFDVVVSNHVLPSIQHMYRAMDEMLRVLKPGGLMCHVIPGHAYAPRRTDTRHPFEYQHWSWSRPESFRVFLDEYESHNPGELQVVTLESFAEFNWSFKFVGQKSYDHNL